MQDIRTGNGGVDENQTRKDAMPRELIEPRKGDKRYGRRGKKGQFTSRHRCRSLAISRPAPEGQDCSKEG
jgi:hypothetical protein